MRILLLTDSDVWAGTERHLLDLALGLRADGAHVVVSCAPGPLARRARDAGFSTLVVPKRGIFDARFAARLRRFVVRERIEIVHAHNGRTLLHAAFALSGKPANSLAQLVFTQHFIAPSHTTRRGPTARLFALVHRLVGTRARRVIAISHAVKNALIERGEVAPQKIVVVPNGTSPQITSTNSKALPEVESNAPLVVCVARLQPEKSLSTLIEAWEIVAEKKSDARLFIAGEGPQKANLQAQIEALNLQNSAQLLGFVHDVPTLLQKANLFVLPAPDEPFGLVFLEAMALNLPIVAAHGGAAPEIVEHEKTGLLVPPRDANALAEAILRLLNDSATARAWGEAGRARFEANFTRERMARATRRVYEEVMNSGEVTT